MTIVIMHDTVITIGINFNCCNFNYDEFVVAIKKVFLQSGIWELSCEIFLEC